ncbi:Erythronate-4-phosphate dehydrogenase family protein [Forsythia ovata]|uniref:Erythronate-4-phosphate dehydrogenase family protein n=1 Tax=Forsythia ovata TaxID=205694 RepID=A0ABD1PWW2_9LAMI
MDFNEEEVLISMRNMENSDEELNENGVAENGNTLMRHSSYQPGMKASLLWLDLRVFYVRISKCVIDDDSTPEYLMLNHVPLNRDTLLEVNGVRTSIYSDGVSTLLKRDRLDKKSEEVTFVSTDSIRMTGSVKFEVFHKDVLVLSGTLELCYSNGFIGESRNQGQSWIMNCESDILGGVRFLKGNQHAGMESSSSSSIEVYVAGCFLSSPIILTNTVQLSHRRKQTRKGMLESIPEYGATGSQEDGSSGLAMQANHYPNYKPEDEDYCNPYPGMEYLEGEDGELSWFNAGVRVGVGIGLSICLGVGIGVGLLVRTYQGTTRNFRRRLL